MNLTKSKPQQKFGRKLRKLEGTPCFHNFEIYSMTREGHQHEHEVSIGIDGKSVYCSCEHFTHRFARTWPAAADTERHCKHISRALRYLDRTKAASAANSRACASCGTVGAAHDLCDDNGNAVPGHICGDCVTRNRMLDDESEPIAEQSFVTIWANDFAAMLSELEELRKVAAQLEYSANAKNGLY